MRPERVGQQQHLVLLARSSAAARLPRRQAASRRRRRARRARCAARACGRSARWPRRARPSSPRRRGRAPCRTPRRPRRASRGGAACAHRARTAPSARALVSASVAAACSPGNVEAKRHLRDGSASEGAQRARTRTRAVARAGPAEAVTSTSRRPRASSRRIARRVDRLVPSDAFAATPPLTASVAERRRTSIGRPPRRRRPRSVSLPPRFETTSRTLRRLFSATRCGVVARSRTNGAQPSLVRVRDGRAAVGAVEHAVAVAVQRGRRRASRADRRDRGGRARARGAVDQARDRTRELHDVDAPARVLAERREREVRHVDAGRAVARAGARNDRAQVADAEVGVEVATEQRRQPRVAHDVAAGDRLAAGLVVLEDRGHVDARGRARRDRAVVWQRALEAPPAEVRPAPARRGEVDLLGVVLADVAEQQVAGLAVEGEAKRVAQPVGVDLAAGVGAPQRRGCQRGSCSRRAAPGTIRSSLPSSAVLWTSSLPARISVWPLSSGSSPPPPSPVET